MFVCQAEFNVRHSSLDIAELSSLFAALLCTRKTQGAGSLFGSATFATATVSYYVWYAAEFALHARPCCDDRALAAFTTFFCACSMCVNAQNVSQVDKQKGLTVGLCFGQVAASRRHSFCAAF